MNNKTVQIPQSQIKYQQIVGTASNGLPVLMIITYGGLYAWFTKNRDGKTKILATAPHRAIGMWMASKEDPNIKWNENAYYEVPDDSKRLAVLYKALIAPVLPLKTNSTTELRKYSNELEVPYNVDDIFIVYDNNTKNIGLFDTLGVIDGLKLKYLQPTDYIRPINLSEPTVQLKSHILFTYYMDEDTDGNTK